MDKPYYISDVRVYWGSNAAKVIMWDLGASNGVVHIIDNVLSDYSDLSRDISASSALAGSSLIFGSISLLLVYLMNFVSM